MYIVYIGIIFYLMFEFLLQKEEMGEVLYKVDFDQLEIENKQYLEKIDQRNIDLLALKLMLIRINGVFIKYKVQFVFEKEKSLKILDFIYQVVDCDIIYIYIILKIVFI